MALWYKVPNYPLEITREGQVRNLKGRVLRVHVDTKGYIQVSYVKQKGCYTTVKLHKILALTFIPNPSNKSQINHIDGDKKNYRLENLEWMTQSENQTHAYRILHNGGVKPLHGRRSGKFKGCRKVGSKWVSRIVANHKIIHIGTFNTEAEAAIAYNVAALQYHKNPILNEV